MREILFRAWWKDGGGLVDQNAYVIRSNGTVEFPEGGWDLWGSDDSHLVVLEQFTGLHDATKWEDLTDAERDEWIKAGHTKEDWKGRRIFDGDIVGFTAENELWEPQYYEGTVYFCDGTFWVDCGKDSDDCDVLFSIGHAKLCDESLQIIGNIHDNPMMLEV